MKPTMATVKSFIKKNDGKLFINCKSSFDGMVDCVMPCEDGGFKPVQKDERGFYENTKGISGAWFVRNSQDFIKTYDADKFKGFKISNCCGSFILAVNL